MTGTLQRDQEEESLSGTVEGNRVHFHFDSEDLDQHGTVSRNRMSGTCTWRGRSTGT